MRQAFGRVCSLALVATVALSTMAEAQTRFEPQGVYVHTPSNTVFPLFVGPFRRLAGAYLYDEAGYNVGVGYRLIDHRGTVELTQYVYPSNAGSSITKAGACRDEFSSADADVHNRWTVREMSPMSLPRRQQPSDASFSQSYVVETADNQILNSVLAVFCEGGWVVKYRVTGPQKIDVAKEFKAYLERGPWPL